jgi:hypothetical protein
LTAACGQAASPGNDAAAEAPAAAAAEETPEERAQRLVRQHLEGREIGFGRSQTFVARNVAVVCGSYWEAGRAEQRFVAVSDLRVFVEPEMGPGEMDRAFAEFCRDGAANA